MSILSGRLPANFYSLPPLDATAPSHEDTLDDPLPSASPPSSSTSVGTAVNPNPFSIEWSPTASSSGSSSSSLPPLPTPSPFLTQPTPMVGGMFPGMSGQSNNLRFSTNPVPITAYWLERQAFHQKIYQRRNRDYFRGYSSNGRLALLCYTLMIFHHSH
jgi:hypothetical protein